MSRITAELPGTVVDPRYPESDGRSMGETEYHNDAVSEIHAVLEDQFVDVPDVLVAANLVMYYQHGNPRARRDPDILVAKGVAGKHKRLSYRVWEEKKLPQVLFEIASRKTWRTDVGEKRELYARLKIREYFIFDPHDRFLSPPLQGFRSVKGQSVPIEASKWGLLSKQLGLYLRVDGAMIRFVDRTTHEPILTRRELLVRERMRFELEHAQVEVERARADALQARADALQASAEQAAAVIAELERLKARIAELEAR